MASEFAMKDLGELSYFLGIAATNDDMGIFLSQRKYAMELFERANMPNCNPSRTRADTHSKLDPHGSPVSDPSMYRSLASGFQYLTFTHPDLSYSMQQMCLFMHKPREPHLHALKGILHYVCGTLDYGLQLHPSSTTGLITYSNANWEGVYRLDDPLVVIVFFLVRTSYLGLPNVNQLSLVQVQKQNIEVSPTL